jgi:hypothetical protein
MSEKSCCICDRTTEEVRDKLKSIALSNMSPSQIESDSIKSDDTKRNYDKWLTELKGLQRNENELAITTVMAEDKYSGELAELVGSVETYLRIRNKKSQKALRVGELFGLLSENEPATETSIFDTIDSLPIDFLMEKTDLYFADIYDRKRGKQSTLQLKGHICTICKTAARNLMSQIPRRDVVIK